MCLEPEICILMKKLNIFSFVCQSCLIFAMQRFCGAQERCIPTHGSVARRMRESSTHVVRRMRRKKTTFSWLKNQITCSFLAFATL